MRWTDCPISEVPLWLDNYALSMDAILAQASEDIGQLRVQVELLQEAVEDLAQQVADLGGDGLEELEDLPPANLDENPSGYVGPDLIRDP